MNEGHNMTLREKWDLYVKSTTEDLNLHSKPSADWFLSQFDSMLAEDLEAIQTRGLFYTGEILEARRKSLKQ